MRTRTDSLPIPQTGLANTIAIVSLGLLTWGVLSYIRLDDTGAARTAALVLLGVAGLSWLTWVLVRGSVGWATGPVLVVLSLAGGALSAFAPLALVFCGVAMLGAAMVWRLPVAALVGAASWLAMLVAVAAAGKRYGIVLGGLSAILAGGLIGYSRRLSLERTEQAARMDVETARAELERARAELLGERNHMAREIHDVLAHTLAALSLQLEAFATVVDGEPGTSPAVREQLETTRRLVREGLIEARGAVAALRDDAAPLEDQLARLCAQQGAGFSTSGAVCALSAAVETSLYRVAQEALTNVMKHAPGATTTVRLAFEPERVVLTVDDQGAGSGTGSASGSASGSSSGGLAGSGLLADSGGGYGLRGIAERLALIGGTVDAGPHREGGGAAGAASSGWRVRAEVPMRPATAATATATAAAVAAPAERASDDDGTRQDTVAS